MLHPLEHVRDQQNPLADTTALASRQAPQLDRPRLAAKEVCRHRQFPQTWYVSLLTLPHLGISASRYKIYKIRFQGKYQQCDHLNRVAFDSKRKPKHYV